MTRAQLASVTLAAEADCAKVTRALSLLRMLLDVVERFGGRPDERLAGEEVAAHLANLALARKPTLKAWAAACSCDPLLSYLLESRKTYRQTDEKRGKGARRLEVSIAISSRGYTAWLRGISKRLRGVAEAPASTAATVA